MFQTLLLFFRIQFQLLSNTTNTNSFFFKNLNNIIGFILPNINNNICINENHYITKLYSLLSKLVFSICDLFSRHIHMILFLHNQF